MALAARAHRVASLLIACPQLASYLTRIYFYESLNYLYKGNRGNFLRVLPLSSLDLREKSQEVGSLQFAIDNC